jgi:hypothetical protein
VSDHPYASFAAVGALTIYMFGYLIPGTSLAFHLLGNIAKHEARRAEEFRILDRELAMVRQMPGVAPAKRAAPLEVASATPGPRLLDGIVTSDAPRP